VPTLPIANTFEGGTNGTTVSAANSGGASGTAFTGGPLNGASAPTYSTARAYEGTVSLASVQTGTFSPQDAYWSGLGSLVVDVWCRFYFYLGSVPTADTPIFTFNTSTQAKALFLRISTAQKIYLENAGGGTIATSTVSVPTGQWCRIEARHRASTTVGQGELWLYNTPGAAVGSFDDHISGTAANTGANTEFIGIGASGGGYINATWNWDAVALSSTGQIGPLDFSGPANYMTLFL
jgi:hypothetical protein